LKAEIREKQGVVASGLANSINGFSPYANDEHRAMGFCPIVKGTPAWKIDPSG